MYICLDVYNVRQFHPSLLINPKANRAMKPDACLSEIIVYIKFMALIDINTSTG